MFYIACVMLGLYLIAFFHVPFTVNEHREPITPMVASINLLALICGIALCLRVLGMI